MNLNELINFAERHKFFLPASWILAGLSALFALVPVWYIWQISVCVIFLEDINKISGYGLIAFAFAVISIIIFFASLFCSHKAAFEIVSNIRVKLSRHISLLPFGIIESLGVKNLERIILDSSSDIKNYLARKLPEKYFALASTFGLVGILLFIDWKFAILSFAPLVLGFIIMAMIKRDNLREKLVEYNKTINFMSNESREYVKTLPVMKIFSQSENSFRRFKRSIENYENWAIAYTSELRFPMMIFTLAVNGAFIFLILAGIFIASNFGVSHEFLKNFILAAISAPLISLNLMRTIRQNENSNAAANAITRINEIFALKPLSYLSEKILFPESPDIELQNVSFAYKKRKILSGINLHIKAGQTLAIFGPSGSGKSTLAKIIARFFDVTEGKILINGIDIKNFSPDELKQKILFISRDSHLHLIEGVQYTCMSINNLQADKKIINSSDELTQKISYVSSASHLIGGSLFNNAKFLESAQYESMNKDNLRVDSETINDGDELKQNISQDLVLIEGSQYESMNKDNLRVDSETINDGDELKQNISQDSHLIESTQYESISKDNLRADREKINDGDELEQNVSQNSHLTQDSQCEDISINNNAEIIILDEIALNFAQNKTKIIITHDLESLKNADIIAVLDDGKIIESGNYNELINHDSKFKSMLDEYRKGVK